MMLVGFSLLNKFFEFGLQKLMNFCVSQKLCEVVPGEEVACLVAVFAAEASCLQALGMLMRHDEFCFF